MAQQHPRTQLTAATPVSPEAAGLHAPALQRVRAMLNGLIAEHRLPGAVALVMRRGALGWFEALGMQDAAHGIPMRVDAIFRIYSMTKPIVSVAVMQLVERGQVRLGDPVARHLPEFAHTPLGIEIDGRLQLVAPPRAMTVHDLLRHTAGLTYEFLPPSAVRKAYAEENIASRQRSNAEFCATLSHLPLMHAPGSIWEYSRATDVLGRLVEVRAGCSLGEYLQRAILAPLGMVDTGFDVPSAAQHRLAEPYALDPDSGAAVHLIDARRPAALQSGGGGLMSTAGDYARFLQMLLDGGTWNGARILGRKTVELMTTDHLGAIPRAPDSLPPGYGFGLGFAVRLEAGLASDPGSAGTYGWSGIAGTLFFVDPQEQLIALLMVQAPGQADEVRERFRNMVCAALDA